jgi:hypothetical protein
VLEYFGLQLACCPEHGIAGNVGLA